MEAVENRNPNDLGQSVKTCSILTATPNAVTSAVHNRMPVRPLEAEPELDRETR
jgi:putative SOS response-associated peptidase YedK